MGSMLINMEAIDGGNLVDLRVPEPSAACSDNQDARASERMNLNWLIRSKQDSRTLSERTEFCLA
jgi:hypothetical protein